MRIRFKARVPTSLGGGLLLGAAIAAIPVFLWGAPWEAALRVGRPWWALAGVGLGVVAPLAAGAGLALGAPVAMLLLEGFGFVGFDGTEPTEIGLALASSVVPAAVGVVAGVFLGRLIDRLASGLGRDELSDRVRRGLARVVTTVAVAAVLLAATEEAGATAAREAGARARTADVWQAQRAWRAERGSYACDLTDLPVRFGDRSPETAGDRGIVEEGYRYALDCPRDGAPGYRLRAEPGWLDSRTPAGRWAYCVDQRGELRRIPWSHRTDPCLLGGEVVRRLEGD